MSFDLSLLVYVDSPERTDEFLSDILDQKESSASIEILLLDGAGSDKPESATKKYNLPGVSVGFPWKEPEKQLATVTAQSWQRDNGLSSLKRLLPLQKELWKEH